MKKKGRKNVQSISFICSNRVVTSGLFHFVRKEKKEEKKQKGEPNLKKKHKGEDEDEDISEGEDDLDDEDL